MARARKPWALIVDDDHRSASALRSLARPELFVRMASTQAEGLAAVRELRPKLVVTDVRCRDGARGALAVLELVARTSPEVPRAFVARDVEPWFERETRRLDATLLPAPVRVDDFRRLVDRALALPIRSTSLALHVVGAARKRNLTPTQSTFLCWRAARRTSNEYARAHGVGTDAVKDLSDAVRAKFGERGSLDALVAKLLGELVDPPESALEHSNIEPQLTQDKQCAHFAQEISLGASQRERRC